MCVLLFALLDSLVSLGCTPLDVMEVGQNFSHSSALSPIELMIEAESSVNAPPEAGR